MTQAQSASNSTVSRITSYDVAEYLKTPEEMAAYLDAWLEEAPEDVADIARAYGRYCSSYAVCQKWQWMLALAERACIGHLVPKEILVSRQYSK